MIRIEGVSKAYGTTRVLSDVSVDVEEKRLTLITGPSGSGKTTLLNLVAAIDRPDTGSVQVGDHRVTDLRGRDRSRYRAAVGLVFQRSGLLGGLTARQNIEVGHRLNRSRVDEGWLADLADRLGVAHVLDQLAAGLSGGQAQRVALLRAVAHRPELVLADEPTAAVDSEAKGAIHDLLRWLVDRHGVTVVVVSHDEISSTYADRVVRLVDGRLTTPGAR
ncbi:ABC transporter ATP-binding protein [Nocardioides maradonensis]